jgi:lipopolysaccharide transport system permease protein
MASAAELAGPVTVIRRRSGWHFFDWCELWRYRELLITLAWRDIAVRYKQTTLGVLWAVLQPLATMLAFSAFLGRLGGGSDATVSYPLFVFSGLLAWSLFAGTVSAASQSLLNNPNLVTKVYCPRLLIPVAAAGAPLADFFVGATLLALFMAVGGIGPGWGLLLVPVLLLAILAAAVGLGALLAALSVAYRDFRYVVPFLIQFGLFVTPGVYLQAEGGVGPVARAALVLNPLHELIGDFRAALFGETPDLSRLLAADGMALMWLTAGCVVFRRLERSFADLI